jgi:hypothetical protein
VSEKEVANMEQASADLKLEYSVIYALIAEMVDELHWRTNTEHRVLVIRALRAVGVSDTDIRGYFAGNIIL